MIHLCICIVLVEFKGWMWLYLAGSGVTRVLAGVGIFDLGAFFHA